MFSFLLVPVVAVNIVFGPCPDVPTNSCYMPSANTIYLKAQDRDSRAILAHELGHAYGWSRGYPQWRTETFADSYMRCALAAPYRNQRFCDKLWQEAPYRLLRNRLDRGDA